MSAGTKLVLLCGALWLITKTVLLYLTTLEVNVITGTLLNLFFIMLIAVFSIHRQLRSAPNSSFLEDVKEVAKNTARYALLAVGLLVVFNYGIAGEINTARQISIEREITSHFDSDEAWQKFIEENPAQAKADREQLREDSLNNFKLYSSWYVQATLALLALVFFALIASVFTTLMWRNLFQ